MRVGLFFVVFKIQFATEKLFRTITFGPAQTYFKVTVKHLIIKFMLNPKVWVSWSPSTIPLYSLYQEKWLLSVAKSEVAELLSVFC